TANNVPMFRAELGTTGDNLALKVLNAVRLK
ncbi:MAG: flagellar motor switch protein FliM, partial [Candidatus Azotimanducaceae bacterium]